jgi:hypothetical protein
MHPRTAGRVAIGTAMTMLLTAASPIDELALAQPALQQGLATEPRAPKDPYQRSLQVYEFKNAAQSGPTGGKKFSITNAGSVTMNSPRTFGNSPASTSTLR